MAAGPNIYVVECGRAARRIAVRALLAAGSCAAFAAVPHAADGQPAEEPSAAAGAPLSNRYAPPQDVLPVPPPADAIVLFDGRTINEFVSMSGGPSNWPADDGSLRSAPNSRRSNHLVSRLHFRDADVHVEFLLPAAGDGNSGIYLHGLYELQILNSFGKPELAAGDMGGVYGLFPPRVNAAREPGQWQVYDIRYRSPRRDADGNITARGAITAWLNGHKVQDHVPIGEPNSKYNPYRYDTTPYLQKIWRRLQESMTGPLVLQDHDNPVRFRNIWVRPLDDHAYVYDPSAD